jgi:hypothetical protein
MKPTDTRPERPYWGNDNPNTTSLTNNSTTNHHATLTPWRSTASERDTHTEPHQGKLPMVPQKNDDMDKPAIYAGRKDTTPRNAQTKEPPQHSGANWVTKASMLHNHANGPTAGSEPRRQLPDPGAHRVTKTREIPRPDNTHTDRFPRLQRPYPGTDRITKATDKTTEHNNRITG